MRELDRVKERIEIRLEPRQVVALAVVTMMFSGALFAAGFVAGRRSAPAVAGAPSGELADIADRSRRPPPAPDGSVAAVGEVEFLFPGDNPSPVARKALVPVEVPPEPIPEDLPDVAPPTPAARAEAAADEAAKVAESARQEAMREAQLEAARLEAERRAEQEAAKRAEETAHAEEAKRAAAEEAARAAAKRADEEREALELARAESAKRAAQGDPRVAVPREPAVPRASGGRVDEDAPEPRATGGAHRYTIQVKASQDKEEVDAFVAFLKKKGYEPQIVLANVAGKGRFYRVRLGRFDSGEAAKSFMKTYKQRTGEEDAGFLTDL